MACHGMPLLLLAVLLTVTSRGNEYFTHTAMDKVPATLGDDVQIRFDYVIHITI